MRSVPLVALVVLALSVGSVAAESEPRGSYEEAALRLALGARGLELDPSPGGKRVGHIVVVNLDVFGRDEGFLRWANLLHVTTKAYVIEREVLLRPGELWDDARVEETRRDLRDPLFSSLVVVAPVKSDVPGQVDLLVVTRDIWSLRMNSHFEVQAGALTQLSLSISENNLFGRRKQAALVFDMDQGAYSIGPQYVDKNIAGSRLELLTKFGPIFSRTGDKLEGSRSVALLAYPLWSLERAWGAQIRESHFTGFRRIFLGRSLYPYDNPDTREVTETAPAIWEERDFTLETSAVRSLGDAVKHRVTLGHQLNLVRPDFAAVFPADPVLRAAFARDFFPRSERSSALFVRYNMFVPDFRVYRNIDGFDLPEDQRLGPEVSAELDWALTPLGSDKNFLSGSVGAGWTFDLGGDGLVSLASSAGARLQAGSLVDRLLSGTLVGATPAWAGARLVARLNVAEHFRDQDNAYFYLGGDSGLRGYPVNEFRGKAEVIGNLELRTLPVRIGFMRAGGLLFWDVGDAADTFRALDLRNDFGIGARMLIPQLQPFVFRFDWAVATQGAGAGLPGRFTAGAQQAF